MYCGPRGSPRDQSSSPRIACCQALAPRPAHLGRPVGREPAALGERRAEAAGERRLRLAPGAVLRELVPVGRERGVEEAGELAPERGVLGRPLELHRRAPSEDLTVCQILSRQVPRVNERAVPARLGAPATAPHAPHHGLEQDTQHSGEGVDQEAGAGFDEGVAGDAEGRELAVVGAGALEDGRDGGGGDGGVEAVAGLRGTCAARASRSGRSASRRSRRKRRSPSSAAWSRMRSTAWCASQSSRNPRTSRAHARGPRSRRTSGARLRRGAAGPRPPGARARASRRRRPRSTDRTSRRRCPRAARDLGHRGAAEAPLAQERPVASSRRSRVARARGPRTRPASRSSASARTVRHAAPGRTMHHRGCGRSPTSSRSPLGSRVGPTTWQGAAVQKSSGRLHSSDVRDVTARFARSSDPLGSSARDKRVGHLDSNPVGRTP